MPKVVLTYTLLEAIEILRARAKTDFDFNDVEIRIEAESKSLPETPSYDNIPGYVLHGIANGDLITPIKHLRDEYKSDNFGLLQAKLYVEYVRDHYFTTYVDYQKNRRC